MRLLTPRFGMLLAGLILLFSFTSMPTSADTVEDAHEIVYFYDPLCSDCLIVEESGVLDQLIADGYQLTRIRVSRSDTMNYYLFLSYLETYDVDGTYPLLFAGEDYYQMSADIIAGYESGDIQASAQNPLKELVDPDVEFLRGWQGLLIVIVAGLLDGINPCAIAMLLMFISILSFLKSKKILLVVSMAYISGILVTYFFIGFGMLTFLGTDFMQNLIDDLGHIIYFIFGLLALFFFAITFYDYWVTRDEQYEKVKNQLPERLRNFNKRIMDRFSNLIKTEDKSLKQKLYIFVIPFIIGAIIGVTEAACTGQIYFFILFLIDTVDPVRGTIYLGIFNLLFVLPLILIAIIAILSKNIMGVSNFVREHLSLIKLFTSIFFLLMMVFFFLYAFGIINVAILEPDWGWIYE